MMTDCFMFEEFVGDNETKMWFKNTVITEP